MLASLPSLSFLDLSHNKLGSFDSQHIQQLNTLHLEGNPLLELRLKELPNLQYLTVGHGNCGSFQSYDCLKSTSFASDDRLVWLQLENLNIRELEVVNNKRLQFLNLSNLPLLKNLKVHGNDALDSLDLLQLSAKDSLEEVLVQANPKLAKLQLPSESTQLRNLKLLGNGIKVLQIKNMPNLQDLYLSSVRCWVWYVSNECETTSLPIADGALEELSLENTGLRVFSLFGLKTLKKLEIRGHKNLTKLSIHHNPELKTLSIDSSLDAPSSLQILSLVNNPRLSSVSGLEEQKKLEALHLIDNGLTQVQLSDLNSLYHLLLSSRYCLDEGCEQTERYGQYELKTKLPLLSLSLKGSRLSFLSIHKSTQLSELSLSDMPALRSLEAKDNKLFKKLSLKVLPQLRALDLPHNALETIDYDGDVQKLSTYVTEGNPL